MSSTPTTGTFADTPSATVAAPYVGDRLYSLLQTVQTDAVVELVNGNAGILAHEEKWGSELLFARKLYGWLLITQWKARKIRLPWLANHSYRNREMATATSRVRLYVIR